MIKINYNNIKEQMLKYGNVQDLMKYFNKENMIKSYYKINGNKALGIDRMSKEKYYSNLDENIDKLVERMKEMKYYPKPIRKVEIPKINGGTREIAISCFEDKIVQMIMYEILNEIYDDMFNERSYGFRPKKSCHMALVEINKIINMDKNINYIISIDIEKFFDKVNRGKLIDILSKVIKDKRFIEYIRRYLNNVIIYKNKIIHNKEGIPQGGIISPILANIYLHYVIDTWFNTIEDAYLIRYADDFIILSKSEKDSINIKQQVKDRIKEYNLKINENKTTIKVIQDKEIEFLGFNIYQEDNMNKFKISNTRINKKYEKIESCININNNRDILYICSKVNEILRGYYNYYGINTNNEWLDDIYRYTINTIINRYSEYRVIIHNKVIKPYIKLYM